eukprot:7395623-Karenia_brevis.AAC.1
MEKIKYGQELAQRMVKRKHLVHHAGEPTLGPGGQDMGFKISMRAAAAVSEGASPYYAPGMAIVYDGFRPHGHTPQGIETRGFKAA